MASHGTGNPSHTRCNQIPPPIFRERFFDATRVCKPGSVLTAIYLALRLLARSSRLLEAVGQTCCFSTALLRDRVYSVKPMLPWAGWALTPPFHPYCVDADIDAAVYLCCTCPEVTLGGHYPLSLPCGARTFLIRCLSACVRGCPTWSRKYCNRIMPKCQIEQKTSPPKRGCKTGNLIQRRELPRQRAFPSCSAPAYPERSGRCKPAEPSRWCH